MKKSTKDIIARIGLTIGFLTALFLIIMIIKYIILGG